MNAPHRPQHDNPFDDAPPLRVVPMHRDGRTGRGNPLVDPDAERAVLAAVLLAPGHGAADRWNELAATVSAEHFSEPRHATIWEAMGRLAARRADIDLQTLPAELRAMEKLNAVGGAQYLGEITDAIPTVAHRVSHGRLVAERSAARAYLDLALRVADEARRGVPAEILREILTAGLARVRLPGTVAPTLGDDLVALFEELENPEQVVGVGTGLPDLDRLLGGAGFRRGFTVLAARPRIGKTALALQAAMLEAARGNAVLYFSFEMLRRELLRRAISAETGVLFERVNNPRLLEPHDYQRCYAAAQAIEALPLHVVDVQTPDCPDTVAAIEAVILGMPQRPTMVVIDTISRIASVSGAPRGRDTQHRIVVNEIAKALDKLSKRLGISLVVLAHLNRNLAAGAGETFRAPRLEDLAESDVIAAAADAVVLMHREDIYPTRKYDDFAPAPKGVVDLLATKVRSGEPGAKCQVKFRGEFQRFEAVSLDPFDAPARTPDYTVERDEPEPYYPEAAE